MSAGRLRIQNGSETANDWRQNHAPAANTQATCTQGAVSTAIAAAGPGSRNVCTGITVAVAGGATAPVAAIASVALIDGVSGGTTYLWGPMPIAVPNVAGALNGYVVIPMFEIGSPNTAMTLEFSGAAGANSTEAVWMTGTTI